MNRVELKNKAKESLKGKYAECIKIILLYGLICFAVGFVCGFVGGILNLDENIMSIIESIISVIISAVIALGLTSFFMKIARGEEVTYKELFAKKDLFIPYIIISLLVGIFTFLWSLLFIIPGIIAAFSYSLVYYILIDNPDMNATDIIKKSKQMMNGHKLDYFVLSLSFIGWIILGAFTFGILYFWLMPYMAVTTVN